MFDSEIKKKIDALDAQPDSEEKRKERAALAKQYNRPFNITALSLMAVCLVMWLFLTVGMQIHNGSIDVWRMFHANLTICEPYMEDKDVKMLRSAFAAMRTKQEYEAIDEVFSTVAKEHSLRLRREQLW